MGAKAWRCECKPGYHCTAGCSKITRTQGDATSDVAHTCELDQAAEAASWVGAVSGVAAFGAVGVGLYVVLTRLRKSRVARNCPDTELAQQRRRQEVQRDIELTQMESQLSITRALQAEASNGDEDRLTVSGLPGNYRLEIPPAPTPKALPHGWVQLLDKGSQRPYYFKSTTKTVRWTRPASTSDEEEETPGWFNPNPVAGPTKEEVEALVLRNSQLAALERKEAMLKMEQKVEAELARTDIDELQVQSGDSESLAAFKLEMQAMREANKKLRRDFSEASLAGKNSESEVGSDDSDGTSEDSEDSDDSNDRDSSKSSESSSSTGDANEDNSIVEEEPSLPSGWVEHMDDASGRRYYYNADR